MTHSAAQRTREAILDRLDGVEAGVAGGVTLPIAESDVTDLVSDLAGKETAGAATAAVSAHVGAGDPHTQYALESALGTLATQNGTFSGTHSGTSSGTNTGDQTNITGNAATVTTNANLTGPITSSGNATVVASQTGTGSKFVMDTSPALVTPALGTPTALTLTNATGLPTAGHLDDSVTYAKMQNVSATDKVLGRSTAGAGDPEEIACTAAGRAMIAAADVGAQRTALQVLAQQQFHLTADATVITSATLANVASVLFAISTGLYYTFEFGLIVRTDALTFSPVVGLITPTFNVLVCVVTSPTGVGQSITASGGSVTVAALPAINTDYLITVRGIINPSASGNLRPQLACSAALGNLTCRRATGGVLTLLAT